MTPMSRSVQYAVGVVAVLVTFLLARAPWSSSAKVIAFAAMAGLLVLVSLRFERRLPRNGPEAAGPDEVMAGAEDYVSEFELAGYRRLGGFRWALRGRLVIETVLASAGLDRYAIATDRVLEVVSRFGDRALITTNSGRAPIPVEVLRQVVWSGAPTELLLVHEHALDLLAERGLRPDRFRDDDEVLRYVRTTEERALRSTRVPSLLTLLRREVSRDERDRELGDDPESRTRIDAWLARQSIG